MHVRVWGAGRGPQRPGAHGPCPSWGWAGPPPGRPVKLRDGRPPQSFYTIPPLVLLPQCGLWSLGSRVYGGGSPGTETLREGYPDASPFPLDSALQIAVFPKVPTPWTESGSLSCRSVARKRPAWDLDLLGAWSSQEPPGHATVKTPLFPGTPLLGCSCSCHLP